MRRRSAGPLRRGRGSRALGVLLVAGLVTGCVAEGGQAGGASQAREGAGGATEPTDAPRRGHRTTLIDLWSREVPAFGVFVPNERERSARGADGERLPPLYTAEGAERLAANPLLDYVFLNLEGRYDAAAVSSLAEGLSRPGADGEKTLLVRIPPISEAGVETTRQRVLEILEDGADGIVFPHVRSPEEARTVVRLMEDADADVWSPSNPDGTVLAMIMVEDPGALAQVAEIADLRGYSVLACGIGSLTRALGGDREAGEAANQEVLAHATRVGRPDMITAGVDDVERRIEEGFLGLLMSGPDADEAIRIGRAAAGR